MNARTAKLIRRYCAAVQPRLNYRSAKHWWNSEPRPNRAMPRRMMKNILTDGHP